MSLSFELIANDIFLTNYANEEVIIIIKINIKILEIDFLYRAISKQFNVKTTLEFISMIVDINKWNCDIYVIANINTCKNLVYQSILVITNSTILILLQTIAFMKDQINHNCLYYYNNSDNVWILWFNMLNWFYYDSIYIGCHNLKFQIIVLYR